MTRTFVVPGISCDHCKHAIETEVGALVDVDRVEVVIADKLVLVDGRATTEAIAAAIDAAGYDVESVRE